MFEAVTHDIRVRVEPQFLNSRSDPSEHSYVWAYTVEITNLSKGQVQLISREWHIIDAAGETSIVAGDGVIGEQPMLRPDDSYVYTSGVPLPTPSGIMFGRYRMVDEAGDSFEIDIPKFSLDSPFAHHMVN